MRDHMAGSPGMAWMVGIALGRIEAFVEQAFECTIFNRSPRCPHWPVKAAMGRAPPARGGYIFGYGGRSLRYMLS